MGKRAQAKGRGKKPSSNRSVGKREQANGRGNKPSSHNRFAKAFARGLLGFGFGAFVGLGLAYVATRFTGLNDPELRGTGFNVMVFWGIVVMVAVPVFVFEFYRTWRRQ